MAATGAPLLAAAAGSFSGANRRVRNLPVRPRLTASSAAVSTPETANGALNGSLRRSSGDSRLIGRESARVEVVEGGEDELKDSAADYLEEAKALIRPDGGPPRWFSPLECGGGGRRVKNAPSLLYLPGIDGVGLGLTRHHRRLGKMFDVWCLHIPVMDRTSFTGLVQMVEDTVRLQYSQSPSRPIYLVGESLGACLAMIIAARNPDIDLVLILANPATSFNKSQLPGLTPLLGFMPSDPFLSIPYLLSLVRGKRILEPQAFEDLSRSLLALSSNFSVLADILPKETLLWKMELLKLAASHANARLHAVKAQTLLLSSGMDPLFPSQEEGERLHYLLPHCEIRRFNDNGHFLFLEDGVDIVTSINSTLFYRRGSDRDFIADYLPPNASEYRRVLEPYRWFDVATSPVALSTLENGQIVRGLSGIPSEGPVLLVGYHMLMGLELAPLMRLMFDEKKILLRGIAHPMMFTKPGEVKKFDTSMFDPPRLFGAAPVSGTNLFKLLSSRSHVLLYPGGVREGLHRKGEAYQLFWPEQSEFVRMAARFGTKIVPFGVVGEDDITELLVDYNDFMKIPFFKTEIEEITNMLRKLRTDVPGEIASQPLYLPGVVPKPPGRLYFFFGKPIETAGRKQELKDKEKAHELYLQVKSEVEKCLAYLKEKREHDPYRSIVSRTLYQAANGGLTAQVPTFDP